MKIFNSKLTELKMEQRKEELTKIINNVIKFFIGEKYIQNEGQRWANDISEQIIMQISEKKIKNYKFICSTTIVQKGYSSLHYSSSCLWIPGDDNTLIVRFENDYLHCFVSLSWIKLPEDNKEKPPSNLNNNKNNNSQKKGKLYSPVFKEKKINNEANNNNSKKNNNSNNEPNGNCEIKLKRSNTERLLNNMNKMNINPMFMNGLGMNMNFPQMGINEMFMNKMNMGQFNYNNLNMNMNPMFMNNFNFPMGMNQMNNRPMNMNPMLMNNIQNRNNQFIFPQMMIAQNNNFNVVNNLNNINNINSSNNNNINISNQNINNNGNINIQFKTNYNKQTFISASPFSKVKDLLINYASRSGINKNLLGNKIFFYYKANVMDINDERFVCEVFENNSIILVTKIN